MRADLVALLAADLPFLTADIVTLLAARVDLRVDGAMFVDSEGRDQLLVGVWRTQALRRAVTDAGTVANLSLRRLLGGLTAARVEAASSARYPWWNCDTFADLARAEELA